MPIFKSYLGKCAIATVSEELIRLLIGEDICGSLNIWKDMTIRDKNIKVSIVIEVKESGSEPQKEITFFTEPRLITDIGESPISIIPIKSIGLVGKIGDKEIEETVAV